MCQILQQVAELLRPRNQPAKTLKKRKIRKRQRCRVPSAPPSLLRAQTSVGMMFLVLSKQRKA